MSDIFYRDLDQSKVVSYGFSLRYEDRHGRKKIIKIERSKDGFEVSIKSGRKWKVKGVKLSVEDAKKFGRDYYKPQNIQ